MSRYSKSEAARAWLDRFSETDRETAADLIDEVLLVSAGEFTGGVTRLFDQILAERKGSRPLGRVDEPDPQSDRRDLNEAEEA